MKIETTKFGEVEINEDLIFEFVEPLLGYEHLKKFALVDYQSDSPFKWLQSLEDMDVALPITVPSFFGIDYEYVLPEKEAKKIEASDAQDLLTLNVVNIPNGRPQDTTINLVGPIVINMKNKKAAQLVLINTRYSVKHRLFPQTKVADPQNEEKIEVKG